MISVQNSLEKALGNLLSSVLHVELLGETFLIHGQVRNIVFGLEESFVR